MADIDDCLKCTLPICDDTHKDCAYVKIKPVKIEKPATKRSDYWKQYHIDNRERRLSAMRKWRETNRETFNAKRRKGFYGNRSEIMAMVKERRKKELCTTEN